jgi:hypothetical protein
VWARSLDIPRPFKSHSRLGPGDAASLKMWAGFLGSLRDWRHVSAVWFAEFNLSKSAEVIAVWTVYLPMVMFTLASRFCRGICHRLCVILVMPSSSNTRRCSEQLDRAER